MTNPTMHAQTLGQCRPVNHYPTSRTIEMHMLPKCWLDINIPTMSNPTMRGRWASVARPSITRRRPHSKCICWLDVEIPTTTNPTMHRHRANVARPTITRLRAQSKCIMLTQCWLDVNIPTMYCNPTMCGRWASVAQPSITQCCAHSECTRWPMHAMLACIDIPTATNPTMRRRWANVTLLSREYDLFFTSFADQISDDFICKFA